jgi:hypothetical protein
MDPPGDESRFRPVPYLVGGGVANLAVGAAALLILVWRATPGWATAVSAVVAAVNLLAGLLNLTPTRGSVLNDGTHLLYSLRSAAGRSALYRQLKINARMAAGARPRDLPETLYMLPGTASPGDPLVAAVLLMKADQLNDRGFPDEAAVVFRSFLEVRTHPVFDAYARAELAYYELTCSGAGPGALGAVLGPSLKKYLASGMPGALRVRAAISAFVDRDTETALDLLARAERRLSALGNVGGAEAERAEMLRLGRLISARSSSEQDKK